jgi:hypothetical protein
MESFVWKKFFQLTKTLLKLKLYCRVQNILWLETYGAKSSLVLIVNPLTRSTLILFWYPCLGIPGGILFTLSGRKLCV